jgi:hypothetical protein
MAGVGRVPGCVVLTADRAGETRPLARHLLLHHRLQLLLLHGSCGRLLLVVVLMILLHCRCLLLSPRNLVLRLAVLLWAALLLLLLLLLRHRRDKAGQVVAGSVCHGVAANCSASACGGCCSGSSRMQLRR